MDIKKLVAGTIVGAIAFFFLGWLMYDILLLDFMRHNPGEKGLIGRASIKFGFLIAGQIFQGFLLAYILIKADAVTLSDGLLTGALIGFAMVAAFDLTIYSTSVIISKKAVAADIMASTVIWSVAGALVGLLIGRKK